MGGRRDRERMLRGASVARGARRRDCGARGGGAQQLRAQPQDACCARRWRATASPPPSSLVGSSAGSRRSRGSPTRAAWRRGGAQAARRRLVRSSRRSPTPTALRQLLSGRASATSCAEMRPEGGGASASLQTKPAPAAEADVTRLVAEREKLMEISNMLRADLNRVVSDGFRAGGGDGAAAAERAEREVARYDAKGAGHRVVDARARRAEPRAQGRAGRWTAADGFERRERATPASAACAAAAADGPSAFGGGAGDDDDDDPTSAGAAERAFQRAAARRATSANSSARARLAAGGSALYDAQDAPRMRAREKLEEAKSRPAARGPRRRRASASGRRRCRRRRARRRRRTRRGSPTSSASARSSSSGAAACAGHARSPEPGAAAVSASSRNNRLFVFTASRQARRVAHHVFQCARCGGGSPPRLAPPLDLL